MKNKTLKKYIDGKWVTLTNPEVTVIQELESGQVSDTNVVVTNYNYTDEGEETTLNETLSVISNDISKLQRNVSWLAEHGGGGGSGSGGTFNPYGFEIDTPQVENGGSIFLKKEEMAVVTVKFRITGGYDGDICRYQYVYDGNQASVLKDLEVNKYETLVFDNTESEAKYHFLKISGINPYGTNIASFSFNMYLSNLSITFAGDLSSDIFYISQNDTVGELPLTIENGLIGSETVVSGSCTQGQPTYYSFTNRTTDPQRVVLKFWDMVDRQQVRPNEDYVVTFSAFAKLGVTELTDTTAPLRVRVVNPSELTVVIGAEGSGGETQIEVQQNALMNYNFNVFAPASIGRYVYYSAVIEKANHENELILGKYYDENTHEEGAGIDSNPIIGVNTIKTETYKLVDSLYNVNDIVYLRVKVWSADKALSANAWKKIKIIPESRSFWERQYYNRTGGHTNPDTLFACWNKGNVVATSKFKWNSVITNYYPISITTPTTVEISLEVLNGNNASGAQTSTGTPFFRVQNHAYGKVDFSNYASEIQSLFTDNQTFTVSVTIKDNNQTGTDHTLFLWGTNNQNGELTNNGFRIDTDKIYWAYREDVSGQITQKTLTCSMPRGEKTTIDFVYGGNSLKIYKNGILNAIKRIGQIDFSSVLPNFAYFGVNNTASQILNNYADIDIYEFAIYTKSLNDMQIAINGKNARIEGSDDIAIAEYNDWLIRNFISSPVSGETPESEFFKSVGGKDEFNEYFSLDSLTRIKAVSKIPTIVLNFGPETTFTEEFFYDSYTSGDVTKDFQTCAGTYYDPNKKSDIDLSLKAALQGTSTLLYRVKNLELMMNEYVDIEGVNVPVLFQPKNIWMPERQFTLKADVVDSAHANNAVIGEWINTNASKIGLSNNPAMEQFTAEENKPLYVDLSGTPVAHYSTKQQKNINYHEDVTIKHTLEGFPVLLFIKFRDVSPEHASTPYKFIGIYSFNLGRYSYYNMGMKFLDSFSRLDENRNDVGCPAVIKYYKEKNTLGSIRDNEIYSFEFDNDANENNHNLPMWSQSNTSITYSLGEFKYPEGIVESDSIWNGGLKNLFEQTSKWLIDNYYGDTPTYIDPSGETQNTFYPIYPYKVTGSGSDKQYERTSDNPITQNNDGYDELRGAIDIPTAARYFMIANAFGMTDSLGKNMTIRSWDGGNKWYTCFYDMDTALGLANDGTESILVTASIDKLKTVINSQTQTTTIETTYHDDTSQYAQHLSKLWGILRSHSLLYAAGQLNTPYYETIWQLMRSGDGALSSAEKFVEMMRERVETCGELIFDCDYNSKYVQQGASTESEASQFLHGTRVDYVRDWLKRHFYYLDGLFDVTRFGMTGTYKDSPYYGEEFMASVNFLTGSQRLPFTVRSTTPSFLKISVGGAEAAKFYIDKENTDMMVYVANSTSPNAQIAIKGSSVLSKFDGLQSGFQQISTQNKAGVIKSLNGFNVSSANMLSNSPFENILPFFNENNSSALDTLDLSGTKLIDENGDYSANLINFDKLLNIDIRNSDVKSITLPQTALESLRVNGSKISTLTLNDQPKITDLSFENCNKITEIRIMNCSSYKNFSISAKPLLSTVELAFNDALETVEINDCNSLQTVLINNNVNLKSVKIINCNNPNLRISIVGSPLESITFNKMRSSAQISLPERNMLTGVTALSLDDCYYFGGFKYGNEEIETYGENNDFVFDITPFTSLDGNNASARNVFTIHYLRAKNEQESPFLLLKKLISGSSDVLTRIFGHVKLTESDLFSEFSNFYIREPISVGGVTPFNEEYYGWDDGDYATNITFDNEILNRCFLGTKCTLSDVYYVFHNIPDVTEMNGTFSDCHNIVTTVNDSLSKDLFTKTPNLSDISNLFNNCNIGGLLTKELLEPIKGNIETFENVFGSNENKEIEDRYHIKSNECFFPVGNIIKKIAGFNPYAYNSSWHEPAEVYDMVLLKTLTELEEIKNSFNDCYIAFRDNVYPDTCELFKTTTNLRIISDSFLRTHGYGSIRNIFGDENTDINEYPNNLESVTNSFSFTDESDHGDVDNPLIDDDGYGVLMPIGNGFFSKIKNSIKRIGGGTTLSYIERSFFNAPNATRGIKKYIDLDDCNGEKFCYDIFKGCNNLEEIPYFFEGIDFGVTGKTYDSLPLLYNSNNESIFSGLSKLKNVNGIFREMKNVKYTLDSEAFKDCSIEYASYAFSESTQENVARKTGMIPFKLFYEEETGATRSSVYGISEQTANELGITGDEYVGAVAEDRFLFEYEYKKPKKTIKNLSYVFEHSTSTAITAYSALNTTFNDWIEDNENYNPVKYYMSINGDTATYTINEHYDPYKKKWNKYVFDGSVRDFHNLVVNSAEYIELLNGELTDDYGNPLVDPVLPQEFEEGYNPEGGIDGSIGEDDTGFNYETYRNLYENGTGIFSIRNYFCPPDIFRYCENARETIITGAFRYSSPTITRNGCGIKGTIPPYLFEPISSISSLSSVFSACKGILPYTWAAYQAGVLVTTGYTYPEKLLSGLTNLYTFSDMFSNNIMWGRTMVPAAFFATNLILSNISGLWANMDWIEEDILQFSPLLFYNNNHLTNVSSLFSQRGPKQMVSSLFTYTNNPGIINCASFMYNATNVGGNSTVPTFWLDWNIQDYRNTYYNISQNIIEEQHIPEEYYKLIT